MAYQEYIGRTQRRQDTVWPVLIRGLAATLDVPEAEVAPEGRLPPLWHWMLFQEWAPASGLGPDGHTRRGGFIPPVHDLPRRMWAGGRLEFRAELRAGDPVRRTSTILKVDEKTGGSGRLVFVTVRHEFEGPCGLCIIEEQDIVYRGVEGAAVKKVHAAPPPPSGAFTRFVQPDPVLLFRYSALTANGHRIHYDLGYVTGEEGYPGLVVHGPLQATWLADLVRRYRPSAALRRFGYRGRRPCFHQNPLELIVYERDGELRLETRDHEGAVCMEATAGLG
ncbi:MAG: MaoC family dehydratase N-terminal domain-containing protein [Acetobacteraceae bacterium]|nr:MaoC family dehydratase N-terminal domain-containing protein [Acetobacteraceae bacterium]MBV8578018.1 MaoC family dehydratase N-terminal domain-containing protein [Acetobacteraceae bacterium]